MCRETPPAASKHRAMESCRGPPSGGLRRSLSCSSATAGWVDVAADVLPASARVPALAPAYGQRTEHDAVFMTQVGIHLPDDNTPCVCPRWRLPRYTPCKAGESGARSCIINKQQCNNPALTASFINLVVTGPVHGRMSVGAHDLNN